MVYAIAAKEAVGYYETWILGPELGEDALGPTGITGWSFEITFERYAGAQDVVLSTVTDPAAEGIYIFDPIERILVVRVLAETLQAIPDTTGHFVMDGDLLATPPGGERFAPADADFVFTVIKGPTE